MGLINCEVSSENKKEFQTHFSFPFLSNCFGLSWEKSALFLDNEEKYNDCSN